MKISLRRTIDAKCRECIYDPNSGAGNWRQQVSACTVWRCPLHRVRAKSQPRHSPDKGGAVTSPSGPNSAFPEAMRETREGRGGECQHMAQHRESLIRESCGVAPNV